MGRMSDLHAATAMNRAAEAEGDAGYYKDVIRRAAKDCEVLIDFAGFASKSEVVRHLRRIATDLREAAGQEN